MVSCPRPGTSTRQHGLALITALLVIAIAFTAVSYIASNQTVWINQAQNLIDRAQTNAVAYKYIQLAMEQLSEDARLNEKNKISYDDNSAAWNNWPSKDVIKDDKDLESLGATLDGKITDAQAKFNLNSLLDWQTNPQIPPTDSFANMQTMRNILTNLIPGLNKDLIDAMLDWIDPNDEPPRTNGAEDIDYTHVAPPRLPYRTANQAFTSVDELRLVKGFDAEIVDTLNKENILTALPTKMNGTTVVPTPVNVNTASLEVLRALFPTLTSTTVKDFTASRPYKDVAEVQQKNPQLTPPGTTAPAIKNYGFSTSYFEVEVTVIIGKIKRKTVALIYRPPRPPTPARPQIVQISYPVVDNSSASSGSGTGSGSGSGSGSEASEE